jgi:hypothetical protein
VNTSEAVDDDVLADDVPADDVRLSLPHPDKATASEAVQATTHERRMAFTGVTLLAKPRSQSAAVGPWRGLGTVDVQSSCDPRRRCRAPGKSDVP